MKYISAKIQFTEDEKRTIEDALKIFVDAGEALSAEGYCLSSIEAVIENTEDILAKLDHNLHLDTEDT